MGCQITCDTQTSSNPFEIDSRLCLSTGAERYLCVALQLQPSVIIYSTGISYFVFVTAAGVTHNHRMVALEKKKQKKVTFADIFVGRL